MPVAPWTAILIYFVVAAIVATIIAIVPGIFTKKRPTKTKLEPYECGVPPTSPMLGRFPVRFYLVAMLFVRLRDLGAFGLIEMATFILVLAIGYAYVWKKGGFSWR